MNSLLNVITPILIATSTAGTPATTTPTTTPTEEVATTTPAEPEPEPTPSPIEVIPPATTTPTSTPPIIVIPGVEEPPTEAPTLPATTTPTTTLSWNPFDSSFLSTIGAATKSAYERSKQLSPQTTLLLLQIAAAAGLVGFFLVEQSILRRTSERLHRMLRRVPRRTGEIIRRS